MARGEERETQKQQNAVSFTGSRRKKWVLGAIGIVGALLFFAGAFFIGYAARGGIDEQEKSLLWMIDAVEKNYHDEVTRDELFDRMYDALELDKFCTHYTPEEYDVVVDSSNGLGDGYGISLTLDGGKVRISRVIQNSPAELAGLKKGMYVHETGDKTAATSTSAVISYLNGTENASLVCGFAADGSDKREIVVKRSAYLAAYCYYADSEATFRYRGEKKYALTETGGGMEGLDGDTAYIAIIQFEGHAAEEFEACLGKMKERGRKNLIIDLRGNGGGYLSILCKISAHLMRSAEDRNPLVTQAHFRSGKVENYMAGGNDYSQYLANDAKIRVLADENSASASEALIGVLISYGTCGYGDIYLRKGTGTARTYGKGVMQSHFTAPDGNVMRLTVADIYWPNERCIHGVGVTEEDGAVPVSAPLLPGERDEFLEQVLAAIAGASI